MANRTCKNCGDQLTGNQQTACSQRCHGALWRKSPKGQASRQREQVERTCIVCGSQWMTSRRTAKYCSDTCKGEHYHETKATHCVLPDDHPVVLLIQQQRAEARREREQRRAEKRRSQFAWRTPRECPGCSCIFVPLYTSNMITCSKRCQRRVCRWRRKAAEANAYGSFTWTDFMRIAFKFQFTCAYCGAKPPGQLDPEHVVPLTKGGANTVANLLPACRPCNADKRDILLEDWNADRKRRGLQPRITTWSSMDPRYTHLAMTSVAAA
jgi:hypothetical protein